MISKIEKKKGQKKLKPKMWKEWQHDFIMEND